MFLVYRGVLTFKNLLCKVIFFAYAWYIDLGDVTDVVWVKR